MGSAAKEQNSGLWQTPPMPPTGPDKAQPLDPAGKTNRLLLKSKDIAAQSPTARPQDFAKQKTTTAKGR